MTQAATLAQLASSGALTADTSGNVGIATTTLNGQLSFGLGTPSATVKTYNNNDISGLGTYYLTTDGTRYFDIYANGAPNGAAGGSNIRFLTNPITAGTYATERMRINEGGALLIGTTGFGGVGISMITPGPAGSGYYSTGNSTAFGYHMRFANPNGAVGSISVTASTTAFTTSSDYRLKENVQPMVGALAKVEQLKPCTYNWKSDGSSGEGFIAHELQSVIPNAVIGEKDAVDEDGTPHYQGVDTSFLVATLTAALQELKAELDVCKAEIAALKGV